MVCEARAFRGVRHMRALFVPKACRRTLCVVLLSAASSSLSPLPFVLSVRVGVRLCKCRCGHWGGHRRNKRRKHHKRSKH